MGGGRDATKRARSLASVAEDIPRAITELIDKALAFDKTERWASAREMREALRKACVEATGAPIAALPRKAVTGLEDTIAPDSAGVSGVSSGEAFDVDTAAAGR